jgi:hypothetical protein
MCNWFFCVYLVEFINFVSLRGFTCSGYCYLDSNEHLNFSFHRPLVFFVSPVMNSDLVFLTVSIRVGFHKQLEL